MTEGILTRSRANSQPNPHIYAPIDFDKFNRRGKKTQTFNESEHTGSEINNSDMAQGGKPEDNVKLNDLDPKDISPETWLEMFKKLNTTLSALQIQITDLQGVKTKVEDFSTQWKESVDHSLTGYDGKNDQQDYHIKLLINMIINLEEKVQVLESRVTAAYKRELKPNIIIHGIPETKDESKEEALEKVDSFFKTVMEIPESIEVNDIFRIGQGKTRPLLAKLKYPNEKMNIFSNAKNLKDKQNVNKGSYFVHDDMTEEQSETRQFYRDLIKENIDLPGENQLKIKMQKGQIMVNNSSIKGKVSVPNKAEILRMDEDEVEKIRATKLAKGPDHVEKGSEYLSYGLKVKSTADVTKAYQKLKIKHADATHISCAYHLQNPIGPYRQEHIDDNDIGIGRAMMKTIKQKEATEIAVFVIRYYGGVHLGKRRFEIAEHLTERTVQAVLSKEILKRKKSQRKMSSGSLSQMSQDSHAESDEG